MADDFEKDVEMRQKRGSDRLTEAKAKAEEAAEKRELRDKVAKVQAAARAKADALAHHTVTGGETLSGIAAQYYGSGTREKWMAIYEANKDTIGDDPSHIKAGQKLLIPRLDK